MDKQRLKSLLYNYEVRIVSIITAGVQNRASKKTVLDRAYREMVRIRLDPLEQNRLWHFATSFYRHCIAAAQRETDPVKRAERLYTVLRNDTPMLEHQKNEMADSIEFRIKHEELSTMLRDEHNFFYCTEHKNPAAGHADYQGKIYYRRNGNLSKEEKRFAKSQKLLAVEDVVLGPVYLCTRRNCKHRLIPISFESAQTGDFRHETSSREISYEESQYNNYKDRLRMLTKMKEAFAKSDVVPRQMNMDIKKTRLLTRAWRNKMKKTQE